MHDIKKACLKLWDILLCMVKTSKHAPFKTKAEVRVGCSAPTFSWGRHHCSQLVTHGPALAGCPLHLARQPLLAQRRHCRRQRWLWSRGSVKAARQGGSWVGLEAGGVLRDRSSAPAASMLPLQSPEHVLCFASLHCLLSRLTWCEPVVVLLSEGSIRWSDIRSPFYFFRLFFNVTLLCSEHTQHSLTPSMRAGILKALIIMFFCHAAEERKWQ